MTWIAQAVASIASRFDSWQNAITGLGTSRDKRLGAQMMDQILSTFQLKLLGKGSPLAERIVWTLPRWQLQNGWYIEGLEGQDDEDFREEMIKLVPYVINARAWGRQYGGCALYIVTRGGGSPETPLNIDSVTELTEVQVWPREHVQPLELETMGAYPNAFRAERFRIGQLVIHRSRLVLFGGVPVEPDMRGRYQGWDRSVLETAYDAIRDAESDFASVSGMLHEGSVGIYKLAGLAQMLTSGAQQKLLERLQLMDMGKSVTRSIVLDAKDEDFVRNNITWSGLADVLTVLMLRLGLVTDMPMTILFGREPAGLNATGESDMKIWQQKLAADRSQNLTPALTLLSRLILITRKIKAPESIRVCYPPFLEDTPTEAATREKTIAETDKLRIDSEVLLPEQVALARFGRPNGMQTQIQLSAEEREQLQEFCEARLKEELDQDKEPPDAPPPPGPPTQGIDPAPGAVSAPGRNSTPSGDPNPRGNEPDPERDPEAGGSAT